MKTALKRYFVVLVMLAFFFTLPVFASNGAKGDKTYKQEGKDAYEMQHESGHDGKHAYGTEDDVKKEKSNKNKKASEDEVIDSDTGKANEADGLAKQREKKIEQERKELGKGSETGQQKREEHSRKWWKFWE
jgi:hypothetical protein